MLRALPAPSVAVSYYKGGDLYYFDDFQINREPGSRRPPCDSLYDVFQNIKDDEAEHVSTMKACQRYCETGKKIVISPHLNMEQKPDNSTTPGLRDKWKAWSERINSDVQK